MRLSKETERSHRRHLEIKVIDIIVIVVICSIVVEEVVSVLLLLGILLRSTLVDSENIQTKDEKGKQNANRTTICG